MCLLTMFLIHELTPDISKRDHRKISEHSENNTLLHDLQGKKPTVTRVKMKQHRRVCRTLLRGA